jgi:protein phosphatase
LLPPLDVHVATRSECGPVRKNNEDRYLVVRFDRSTHAVATNIDEAQLRFLPAQSAWALAVADGMGGHAAGEVASTLALSLALRFSQQGSRWFVSIGESEATILTARLEEIVRSVDQAIVNQASERPSQSGMGTTLTVLVAVGDCGFVCHVGDSRAYLLRQGHLVRITRDHTVAQEMVDAGLLDAEEMVAHHGSQVLTQAMGRGDLAIEMHTFNIQDGDRLLLTTDGLTDPLRDSEIEQILMAGDCRDACDRLVERSLAAGSRDNVTAVVADVEIP